MSQLLQAALLVHDGLLLLHLLHRTLLQPFERVRRAVVLVPTEPDAAKGAAAERAENVEVFPFRAVQGRFRVGGFSNSVLGRGDCSDGVRLELLHAAIRDGDDALALAEEPEEDGSGNFEAGDGLAQGFDGGRSLGVAEDGLLAEKAANHQLGNLLLRAIRSNRRHHNLALVHDVKRVPYIVLLDDGVPGAVRARREVRREPFELGIREDGEHRNIAQHLQVDHQLTLLRRVEDVLERADVFREGVAVEHAAARLCQRCDGSAALLRVEQRALAEKVALLERANHLVRTFRRDDRHLHLPVLDEVKLVSLLALGDDFLPLLEPLDRHLLHHLFALRVGEPAEERHGAQRPHADALHEQLLERAQDGVEALSVEARALDVAPQCNHRRRTRLVVEQRALAKVCPRPELGHLLLSPGRILLAHHHLPSREEVKHIPDVTLRDDHLSVGVRTGRQRRRRLHPLLERELLQKRHGADEVLHPRLRLARRLANHRLVNVAPQRIQHAGRLGVHRERPLARVQQRLLPETVVHDRAVLPAKVSARNHVEFIALLARREHLLPSREVLHGERVRKRAHHLSR
mmetsp:Transcript_18003/g.58773  ORF Transcript_18003/g.58773 Transcript_18003/m.58773 type:complete len:575 (+) Transcript_18003:2949-4673(+)